MASSRSNLLTLPCPTRTTRSSGERLRSIRVQCGLTQERAAQLTGKDPRQVRRWENGERPTDALDLYLALEELAANVKGRAA